ncbi:MAG: hypothetical protein DRO43_02710 [Candidatus Hecatellales archaeon]|nr:MAG: hypothetical protein DRO43_02710 [Candidatus Hecatellales archaeon]
MVRLEVVAPSAKADLVIKRLGDFGDVHFIDVASVKAEKYKEVAEKIERTPREENLIQLSNRINNLLRKLTGIPYPEPLKVKADVEQALKEVEREIVSLEMEYAKLENMMKVAAEERATMERELSQFNDEYESTRGALTEFGVKTEKVEALTLEDLKVKARLKTVQERMAEIQKVLMEADMAAKLTSPHEELPQSVEELKKVRERVSLSLEVNQKLKVEIAQAADKIAKIEEILKEVLDVVERKLEAAERLEEAKKETAKLKTELEAVEKELSPKLLSTLGEAFSSSLKEAVTALENLEKLEFGASGFEETARNFAKTVHNLSRSYEALEAVERFMGLQHVKALMEEIRKAKPEEVESLFNRSRELVEVTPARYMAMLERGLKLVHLEHRIKLLTEEPLKVKGMLDELASKSSQIHAYKELVDIELTLENLKKRFMQTGKTMVFEAWVPKGRVEEAVKAIRQACPEALVSTNREEREEKVPTLLVNPKPIICFEKLVSSYSLPSYYEIDPTLIMLVTFPIIFGFMFGDMGHGLVLLVGSLLIKPLFDRMKIRNEMLDYLYKGRNLVFLCGITSIIIGFLYGDFFGPTNAAYAAHHGTPTWYTAITGVEDAPWFSPMDEPMMLFKIAIFIGIAQITFGLILDIVNNIAAREYKEILAPASWLWFYGSLSYLIITYGFGIANVLFETDKLLAFFVVPFAGLFILHKLAGKSGMETFAEGVEKAIASISNTLSYGRILALGLAHAIFSDLALMGKGLLFWPIFLIVTIFIITALEGILTFAHTLRLHWVEWFSKFYRGEGTPFEGFKIERRFTVTA